MTSDLCLYLELNTNADLILTSETAYWLVAREAVGAIGAVVQAP